MPNGMIDGYRSFLEETRLPETLSSIADFSRNVVGYTGAYTQFMKSVYKYGGAAPKPYDLIQINPADVTHVIVPKINKRFGISKHGTYVLGGDWDDLPRGGKEWIDTVGQSPQLRPFEQYRFFRSLKRHFLNNEPWDSLSYYQELLDSGYSSTEVDRRLAQIDSLYESIRTNGYRTQRELKKSGQTSTQYLPMAYAEIRINIGRSGELLWSGGGRHRLAIAKVLGLESVPVRVWVRHQKWQQRRVEQYQSDNNKNKKSYYNSSHPDLVDLQ